MAYINVNHSKFEQAASAIDTYVSTLRGKMSSANMTVSLLPIAWQGKDAEVFRSHWNRLDDEDSTYRHMVQDLEKYAKFLREAASKYKKAQTDAYNRANGLPRW